MNCEYSHSARTQRHRVSAKRPLPMGDVCSIQAIRIRSVDLHYGKSMGNLESRVRPSDKVRPRLPMLGVRVMKGRVTCLSRHRSRTTRSAFTQGLRRVAVPPALLRRSSDYTVSGPTMSEAPLCVPLRRYLFPALPASSSFASRKDAVCNSVFTLQGQELIV